jgi:hypothetical protein
LRFFITGFSLVPCAFGFMTSSSAMMGYLESLPAAGLPRPKSATVYASHGLAA